MYEQVEEDFNNVQLELLSVQQKLLAMEKGSNTIEVVIPKLLAVFYKVQVFSWKLNPYLSKLIKGIYISVAVILNQIIKQLEQRKLKQENQNRSKQRLEAKVVVAQNGIQFRNMSSTEFQEFSFTRTPICTFQREYIQNLEPNDVKICKEFQQFIKCVKGIEQSSESFFKSLMISQDSKIEGVEYIDDMIGKFQGTKEKLSRSFENQHRILIASFRDLLKRFIEFKQKSSLEQEQMLGTIKRLEAINQQNLSCKQGNNTKRRKLQNCTQSSMTAAHIHKLQHELQIKIIQLEQRQKRIKTIVSEIYELRSKIDNQDIERDSHKREMRNSVIAFNQLQEEFKKVCEYAATVQDHHMDLTDTLDQVSSLGLEEYVDQKQFSEFSMNFKVSLFSIFKKIVGKYSKVTTKNKEKIQAVRRSTISEGNINLDKLFSPYKEKKKSMMLNPIGLPSDVNIQPIDEESSNSEDQHKQSKGKYVENMFKKSLGLDSFNNSASDNQSNNSKSDKKRLPKGSIRRLGSGFGWKNDELSNDDMNKHLTNGMRNKLDIDGMIQNNIEYHRSMIKSKSRSQVKTPSQSQYKYQQSINQTESKKDTQSKTNNIQEQIEEQADPVQNLDTNRNNNNKPKTSSGFRRTIDEIIKKAANQKLSLKHISKTQNMKNSTVGVTKRSSIDKNESKFSRQSDQENIAWDKESKPNNLRNKRRSRDSFKSKKVLSTKINSNNVRWKQEYDIGKQESLKHHSSKRQSSIRQGSISTKKLPDKLSKNQRANTIHHSVLTPDLNAFANTNSQISSINNNWNQLESISQSNPKSKKSTSKSHLKLPTTKLHSTKQTLTPTDISQYKHRSPSKNIRSSNISYRRSSIIDTNESQDLKRNKLLIGELKLILDIPMALVNKRIRQQNSIEEMIREAEQLHLKRCGSTFCTHLLRFYESYRKVLKDANKKELKIPTFSIGVIERY